MNNEIKEILEYIKKWMGLSEIPMIVKLEDYITNLQEEKDTYKEQLRITHKDLEHYISRCEKAIEYIENPRHEMSVLTYQNLLNILQGSDNE